MELHEALRRQLAALDIVLAESVLNAEIQFLSELLRWNKTYNLTAITDPLEAVEKHLVDSLTLLPYLCPGGLMLDIGSGGGFPGIPLRLANPGLAVVSVDAVAKKIAFQRHATRRLGLSGFTPWHGRIEQLPEQTFARDGFDWIVARAFASLPELLGLALPCLRSGGQIVAMKGPEGGRELSELGDWLRGNGLICTRQVLLTLPESGAERHLLFFSGKPQDVE